MLETENNSSSLGLPAGVLAAYGIEPGSIVSAGGTAGKAWKVEGADGRSCFFRRRGPRTSSPERLAFDHGLREYLADRGFPAFPALRAKSGVQWVFAGDGAFEAYPWVAGAGYSPAIADAARTTAAKALARLHRLAASYPKSCEPRLPQFGHYPAPIVASSRFDDPGVLLQVVDFVREHFGRKENRGDLDRAREAVVRWAGGFAPLHERLLPGVIHGDYNACNLLFAPDGEVCGVFDFDWAWRDVPVRDVAVGMFFFGARRPEGIDSGSIWSLTACPDLDLPGVLEFVRAYCAVNPLTGDELDALLPAMLGCWIAFRTEGLMKVPEERRAEFFLKDFFRPFEWVSEVETAWGKGLRVGT